MPYWKIHFCISLIFWFVMYSQYMLVQQNSSAIQSALEFTNWFAYSWVADSKNSLGSLRNMCQNDIFVDTFRFVILSTGTKCVIFPFVKYFWFRCNYCFCCLIYFVYNALRNYKIGVSGQPFEEYISWNTDYRSSI